MLSSNNHSYDGYNEWIHDTPNGCVIRMYDFKRHILVLKRGGVSRLLRKNLIRRNQERGYLFFRFDSDADDYLGIESVDF